MIVGTVLFTMVITPQVHAASVVLSPSLLTIIQGESASSTVAVYGMPNSEYALTASGLYGEFDPAYVITDGNGYGTSVFTADSAAQAYSVFFGVPYCPGVHPFTVSAVSGGGLVADSGSASGTLTVTSAGPIQLAASTDKPTYTEGDEVTVGISLSRAAHGTITVTPPSGKASSYSFESTAVTPTVITKTFKVTSQYGGWTVSVQANDYCGLITSTSTSFTVNPMTYDVYVSIAGVSALYICCAPGGRSESRNGRGITEEIHKRLEWHAHHFRR